MAGDFPWAWMAKDTLPLGMSLTGLRYKKRFMNLLLGLHSWRKPQQPRLQLTATPLLLEPVLIWWPPQIFPKCIRVPDPLGSPWKAQPGYPPARVPLRRTGAGQEQGEETSVKISLQTRELNGGWKTRYFFLINHCKSSSGNKIFQ